LTIFFNIIEGNLALAGEAKRLGQELDRQLQVLEGENARLADILLNNRSLLEVFFDIFIT